MIYNFETQHPAIKCKHSPKLTLTSELLLSQVVTDFVTWHGALKFMKHLGMQHLMLWYIVCKRVPERMLPHNHLEFHWPTKCPAKIYGAFLRKTWELESPVPFKNWVYMYILATRRINYIGLPDGWCLHIIHFFPECGSTRTYKPGTSLQVNLWWSSY